MNNNKNAGFTIIEMILAVAIVAMLAAIAVPKYNDYQRLAKVAGIMQTYSVIREQIKVAASSKKELLICNDSLITPSSILDTPYMKLEIIRSYLDAGNPIKGAGIALLVSSVKGMHTSDGPQIAQAFYKALGHHDYIETGIAMNDSYTVFKIRLTDKNDVVCSTAFY